MIRLGTNLGQSWDKKMAYESRKPLLLKVGPGGFEPTAYLIEIKNLQIF